MPIPTKNAVPATPGPPWGTATLGLITNAGHAIVKTKSYTRREPLSRKTRKASRRASIDVPLAVRISGVDLDEATLDRMRRRLDRAFASFAPRVDRATVRVRDLNGPRGGIDHACVIKVALSGLPTLVAEARAKSPRAAFGRAVSIAARAARRSLKKASPRIPRPERKPRRGLPSQEIPLERSGPLPPEDGSLIGRRVGRSKEQLRRVAERPEKLRRDAWVDTAQPGTSASDRKVGAGSTARRNTKLNTRGMTSMLEDSAQDRPSRKSTRRSANRAKRDSGLRLRATTRAHAPGTRARGSASRVPRRG